MHDTAFVTTSLDRDQLVRMVEQVVTAHTCHADPFNPCGSPCYCRSGVRGTSLVCMWHEVSEHNTGALAHFLLLVGVKLVGFALL
jgi:hypothetical protein